MRKKKLSTAEVTSYNSTWKILDQLSEIPTSISTYEFLGELFFEYVMKELENDPPCDEKLRLIRTVRYDVFQLFELARAAKEIKQSNNS